VPNVIARTFHTASKRLCEVACLDCKFCTDAQRVFPGDLEDFCVQVFSKLGVPLEEARTTAKILVSADLRGVFSHGVARLGRYIKGIQEGFIVPNVKFDIIEPVPAIAIIDAKNGIGQVVSEMAMDLAIEKAEQNGIGMVTVKRSNHYGIAGYYALKALKKRMIGVSTTNTAPLVVPTFSREILLGTNPLAFGAPSNRYEDFVLDTATSVVPRGKLEVYDRNLKQMPRGWTVDENGFDCQNPGNVLSNLLERIGGGILPLGGRGDQFGGHKGYGLGLMVDILSGVLSGSAFGRDVDNVHQKDNPSQKAAPNVGHFFMAIDVKKFMPLEEFETRMDKLINGIKESQTALDQERIYVHGEKSFARTKIHTKYGIPIKENVFNPLTDIAQRFKVKAPRCVIEK